MAHPRIPPATADLITLLRSKAAARLLQAEAAEARGDPATAGAHRRLAAQHTAEAEAQATAYGGCKAPSNRSDGDGRRSDALP